MRKTILVGILCLLMMAVLTVMGAFTFPYQSLIYSAVSVILFSGAGILLKATSPDVGIRRFFRFRRPRLRNFFLIFWGTLSLVFGSFLLNFLTSRIGRALGFSLSSSLTSLADGGWLISLVTVAIIPAVFEEIFFRGAVMSVLSERGTTYAVFVSAAFFVLMHGLDPYFLSTFFAGVVLACVVTVTGSVYSSMVVHLVNNIMSYVLILYAEKLAIVQLDFYMLYGAWLLLLISLIGLLTSVMHHYKKRKDRNRIPEREEQET